MAKHTEVINEKKSKDSNLLESLERNANKLYTTAPIHGRTQPLEKIAKRLEEAYKRGRGAKEINNALFVNSFPEKMVRSILPNDTAKRLETVNDIQSNSPKLLEDFLTSPAESKDKKLDIVLSALSDLRETIPVTRRMDLNRKRNNSWTESISSSSTNSKERGIG